jgi:ribonucleoside-diphosphate reductase alpha chain
MIELHRPSPFIDLAAVEAWDTWFRWREGADLRDFSIEDTWRRVSDALASVESDSETATWRVHFTDALASWRLLPDERLLADAGTGKITWRDGALHASLNAAAFVSPDPSTDASLDIQAFGDCAALAVRALDNAALLAGMAAPHLRIGIVGLADALALLGLHYWSNAGRAQAAAMARALAEGCLQGSVMLAAARGAHNAGTAAALARAERRGAPAHLLGDVARHGLRHTQLTAITSQPRPALLANDVADAVDPLCGDHHARPAAAPDGPRMTPLSGYALNLLRSHGNAPRHPPDTLATLPWVAQIEMRAALQPWMDEPIDYPLLATNDLGEAQRLEARKLAVTHGLGDPVWRDTVELQSP